MSPETVSVLAEPQQARSPAPVFAIIAHPGKDRGVTAMGRLLDEALRDAGGEARIYRTRSLADAADQARRALDEGAGALVAGGGDGMFLGLLDAVGTGGVPLLLPPLGTSNDYARMLGLSTLQDAARAAARGQLRDVDLGACTCVGLDGVTRRRFFASSAGVGYVAGLLRWESSPLIGRARRWLGDVLYTPLVLTNALLHPTSRGAITFGDVEVDLDFDFVELHSVADTGGFALVPDTAVDNGRFDILATRSMRAWSRMAYTVDVLRRRHLQRPETIRIGGDPGTNVFGVATLRSLTVRTAEPTWVHLHGELVGRTPATFELLPAALRVYAKA